MHVFVPPCTQKHVHSRTQCGLLSNLGFIIYRKHFVRRLIWSSPMFKAVTRNHSPTSTSFKQRDKENLELLFFCETRVIAARLWESKMIRMRKLPREYPSWGLLYIDHNTWYDTGSGMITKYSIIMKTIKKWFFPKQTCLSLFHTISF